MQSYSKHYHIYNSINMKNLQAFLTFFNLLSVETKKHKNTIWRGIS